MIFKSRPAGDNEGKEGDTVTYTATFEVPGRRGYFLERKNIEAETYKQASFLADRHAAELAVEQELYKIRRRLFLDDELLSENTMDISDALAFLFVSSPDVYDIIKERLNL